MENILQQLIDMVKATAPALWAIYIKQAYIYGAQEIAWSIVFLVLGTILFRIGKNEFRKLKKDKNYDAGGGYFAFVGTAITWIAFVLTLVGAVAKFVNPEYYAIQIMLSAIK